MEQSLPAELPIFEAHTSDYSEREQEIIQEYHKVQPLWQFALLCFFTFGIYEVYWFYKNFYFFKEMEEDEDTKPFWRAIFIIFFGNTLFKKILHKAQEHGYSGYYPAGWLLFAFFIISFMHRLPDPLWLVSLFSFLPLLPIVKARNYFFSQFEPEEKRTSAFTGGEIATLVFGVVFFLLVVLGLVLPESSNDYPAGF
ncbi:DUF4234 domain-containing protein [Rufibacter roseus]|uniref:DUF4234 domain-containing protein n=1 Tax=Rufibacter roseus TaxID=1567108 RepID=A0ABW2DIQ8_9BACT|nr:DUF4234 domain-containing protein [Rufibacter roseus]